MRHFPFAVLIFVISISTRVADGQQAHAKRVCSERFSALSAPIGDFGTQIDQPVVAQDAIHGVSEQKAKFRTLFVTRSLGHERLLPFLKTARPDIVQIGNYGAMFHGFADNPKSMKSPMILPVPGERATLAFQKELNQKVHDLGLTVVGHFRLVKVMGDWNKATGFVEYYNKRWPTDLLGAKPHADLRELLQRDADGLPIQVSRYDNAQLTLCLSSPHARKMLKQMLKCAIDQGVDGIMTTYNYHFECACPYCQAAFKDWLSKHLTPEQVVSKLGISKLETHKFRSIPAKIPGYPDLATATELDWLATKWGAEHFKQMYDDIFIDYGRRQRKDLIVSQWNHLGQVSLKEERAFLPLKQWGQGEDYFWYSGGASFVGKNLKLSERKAGDAWLSSLYIRELSGGKPFVMGKYDGIRMAASMAEGYACQGLGMGRYMRFENPTAFETLARYTNFRRRHERLYAAAVPLSDVALVLPRQSVLQRNPDSLDAFRELGQELVERQLLVDILADENIADGRLKNYLAVALPQAIVLSDSQLKALHRIASQGGQVLYWGKKTGTKTETGARRTNVDLRQFRMVTSETPTIAADVIAAQLKKRGGTSIKSPWTVRAAAYVQPTQVVLHLVNYNRDESIDKTLKGPELERPISAQNIAVDFRLPDNRKPKSVVAHSPDRDKPMQLDFEVRNGRVIFILPELKVYSVISIE